MANNTAACDWRVEVGDDYLTLAIVRNTERQYSSSQANSIAKMSPLWHRRRGAGTVPRDHAGLP